MSIVVTIAAVVGTFIIAITVWQIAKHGIPDRTRRWDDHWADG